MSRIVYSTCSIHKTEDESVVSRVLAHSRAHPARFNGQSYVWVLEARDNVLPTWERRGLPDPLSAGDAQKVIRCAPEDHTNGFFVACFKRIRLEDLEAEIEAEIEADVPEPVEETAAAPKDAAGVTQKKGKDEGKGKSKKRPVEDEGEEVREEEKPAQPKKQKTAAQLERARRKKKAQKAKAE